MKSVSGSMAGKNALDPVREQAEAWFARLMAPDCTPAEHAQFQRWLTEDNAHAQAYDATERLWNRLEGMEEDEEIAAFAAEALEPEPAAAQRSRWFVPATLAASILVAAAGWYFGRQWLSGQQTTVGTGTYIAEQQPRQLLLEDGSIVKLDIETELKVALSTQSRVLQLDRGRAMFDVALDRNRPFTVHAGDGQVVALGTRFQVDRTGDRIKVVLTEGAVLVTQATGEVTMAPGEELVYAAGETWTKRTIDPEPATSWALGYHVFRATPLGEAVREINRYAARKIRLADPTLADLPVSGSFKTGDSESIATALPSVLPVRIEQRNNEIELTRR